MLSPKPWRIEAVIMLLAGAFGCLGFGMVLAGLLRQAGLAAFQTPDSPGNILLGTLSFHGAVWVLMLVFLALHGMDWREAFGLRDPNLKRALVTALVVVLPVLLVAWGLQFLSVWTLTRLGFHLEDEQAVALMLGAKSPWLRVYLGVFAIVIAPVAEEFVFRGTLYPLVKQLGFPKLALLGVSFLFALIHFNVPTFVPLFFFALAQTWLYERTDNLLAPITVHALFNAANLVALTLTNGSSHQLPVQP